ncbi:hypothetical protein [Saccharopolyspora flava]|uniref:hypothetical protein n=1 Tax=Saccharopolyspora flava TaxID=95161 RepID=UPI001114C6D2|nr:hypothetical protein [Saccharopolyspora flava]
MLLRKTQWLLDDLAFEVGSGRADQIDFTGITSLLESVTAMLREEQRKSPGVVDGATESARDGFDEVAGRPQAGRETGHL